MPSRSGIFNTVIISLFSLQLCLCVRLDFYLARIRSRRGLTRPRWSHRRKQRTHARHGASESKQLALTARARPHHARFPQKRARGGATHLRRRVGSAGRRRGEHPPTHPEGKRMLQMLPLMTNLSVSHTLMCCRSLLITIILTPQMRYLLLLIGKQFIGLMS
jgi:hypothetical protein